MKLEETIVNLEKLIALFHAASEQNKMVDYSKIIETLEFALSALRPVSRERVERMRGEWISTGAISCKCSRCNHLEPKYRVDEYNCCPYCMAPMTDEAVQTVMERMEALNDV